MIAASPDEFEELLDVLRRTRGFDFTGYKRSSLTRRVRHRMHKVGIHDYGDYRDRLELDPQEFTTLFDAVLINVTSFFRDQAAWDAIRDNVIPAVLDQAGTSRSIRVWSAGCASGEEVYTLAMLLADALGEDEYLRRVKIYATDVDPDALATCRAGRYTDRQVEGVPTVWRERYFEPTGPDWSFRRDLRGPVVCGRNDLTGDAPISRIDLLSCRNTLMYFTAETQERILRRFYFGLADGGFLLLGNAEMLLQHPELFTPVDLPNRLFHRAAAPPGGLALAGLAPGGVVDREPMSTPIEAATVNSAPMAQLVVDTKGRLVVINARAEALLGLQPRDVGRQFNELEVSYRPVELRTLIEAAQRDRRSTEVAGVRWSRSPAADPTYLDVVLTPLFTDPDGLIGVSVSFTDTTALRKMGADLEQSHDELERAYEELQATNEELETTNEELHSTIEELETTNDELHSTNAELELMNQELQSTSSDLQELTAEPSPVMAVEAAGGVGPR